MSKTLPATDLATWREWLTGNHASEKEVWLIFPKVHTGRKCMTYEESVEEALCHGWIDSIVQRVDEDHYARKFTPRTNKTLWSDLNKRRIAKLIQEGRMKDVGLSKISYSNPERAPRTSKQKALSIPNDIERTLRADGNAWTKFAGMPPSHKRAYIGWILDAKREETRRRRLEKLVEVISKSP